MSALLICLGLLLLYWGLVTAGIPLLIVGSLLLFWAYILLELPAFKPKRSRFREDWGWVAYWIPVLPLAYYLGTLLRAFR